MMTASSQDTGTGARITDGKLINWRGEFPYKDNVTLVSVAIAAEESNMDANHLRRLIREGVVPHRVVDGMYYINQEYLPIRKSMARAKKATPIRKQAQDIVGDGPQPSWLDADEWSIISQYANGYTLAQIAEGFDYSRQRVHQIIKEIIERAEDHGAL